MKPLQPAFKPTPWAIIEMLEQFAKRCSRWSEKILAKARRCDNGAERHGRPEGLPARDAPAGAGKVDRHPRLSKNAAMDKRFRSFRSLGEAANFPHLTTATGYGFEQNALIPKVLCLCLIGLLPLNAQSTDHESSEANSGEDAHKSYAEAATVTIESNLASRGAGATGFIVEINDKKYVLTNIHVLHGEAEDEIGLLWRDGPNDSATLTGRKSQKSRINTSYQEFQKQAMAVPMFKVHSQSGELRTGESLVVSGKRDVAFIPVETDIPGLKFSAEPPSRGEAVFVVGNPGAEHTLIVCDGTIKSTGPDRLEIENIEGGLKAGMSGGPVVSRKTGQVLGVVSYKVTEVQMSKNFDIETIDIDSDVLELRAHIMRREGQVSERNFAFRVDEKSNLDFSAVTWKQFLLDCAILEAMTYRTFNIALASKGIVRKWNPEDLGRPINIGPDFDNSIQMCYSSAIQTLSRKFKENDDRRSNPWESPKRTNSDVDLFKLWDSFISDLASLNNQDFADPKNQIKTAYLKNIARERIAPIRAQVTQLLREKSGQLGR
jgi:S1-C subfamily serine protease